MLSFKQYISESFSDLTEALITFAGQAYPKFGNVVILAGGAGSGKGFVKNKLIGMEGFNFDVDELKSLSMRTPKLVQKIKDEFGVDPSKLDLKNPIDVAKLHEIIGNELNLDDRRKKAIFTSILTADPSRKPNLIFDVTLKDLRKLQNLSNDVKKLGYDNEKIHIVWIINDIEVAKKQNIERPRQVPVEILVNTHRGASMTMHDIINMGNDLKKYMDGDIVFAFNKVKIDSEIATSDKGGMYIKNAKYFYVKRAGQPPNVEKLARDVREKIALYVPPSVSWS
jgi:predicted kinase